MRHIFKKTIIIIVKLILSLALLTISVGYCFTFYKERVQTLETPTSLQRASIKDGYLTYLTYGDKGNQTVVLLHGTGANAFIWEKTSTFLAEQGYYVLAVDVAPFGWSSIPEDQDYRKEVQAKKIIELLHSLSVTNPIILGHSYNSKIALQIVKNFSSKKLILVAPILDYKKEISPLPLRILSSISVLRDPLLSLFVNNKLFADDILLSFMYKKNIDIETVLDKLTLPFNKKGINHAYGEWFQEFFDETSVISDADTLNSLTLPIETLWGKEDSISEMKNFDTLKTLAPGATLNTIHDVGHMPHLENNILFNETLLKVIK